MFVSSSSGLVVIIWTTENCTTTKNITIVAPPIAVIPPLTQRLCGSSGSANVGVYLSGDAISGLWTATRGSFSNNRPAFTLYSWTDSGTVTLKFTPVSALSCSAPALLTVEILDTCPLHLTPLEVAGIACGALLAIVLGVFAAITCYRWRNRRLADIRQGERDVNVQRELLSEWKE